MIYNSFSSLIIFWYKENLRLLPWRETKDPYLIWVSEIILQQTRVAQGLPYYNKFTITFPTINDLANANEQEVLSIWQGLGYYSRARNMHKCAQAVVVNHNGYFPKSFSQLLKLPGIGPYTAAAIASLAYNMPTPVVDGNVYRVLARVFGLENNIADAKSFKVFYSLSEELIDHNQPGNYNQGVMELGATVCLPQNPKCDICPIEESCLARQNKTQSDFPVKIKKIKRTSRYFTYLVVEIDGKLAMSERTQKDIWKGMYEFYLIENKTHTSLDDLENDLLKNLLGSGAVFIKEQQMPKHILSHQTLYSSFLYLKLSPKINVINWLKEKELVLYSLEEIVRLPKPVLITNYLNSVLK